MLISPTRWLCPQSSCRTTLAYKASQIRSALHPDQRIFPESGGALVCRTDYRKLRRRTRTSVRQLNADILAWVYTRNDNGVLGPLHLVEADAERFDRTDRKCLCAG
jgi:hypothetical protein